MDKSPSPQPKSTTAQKPATTLDEELQAIRERVQAALNTPEALARLRERFEMSRRWEEEHGSPGAYCGELR